MNLANMGNMDFSLFTIHFSLFTLAMFFYR